MACLRKGNDTFISCPFNKQHQVLASRLQYHIVRCMVNYPEYKTCPYNACHRMKPEDMKDHLMMCPNKNLSLDNDIGTRGNISGPMYDTPESFHFQYEDWTK